MTHHVIELDGRRYILDESASGQYDAPDHADEHVASLLPTEADILPGVVPSYDTTWVKQMEARVGSDSCLVPGCPKPNRGGRSKFCSYRHERVAAARKYRRKQHGVTRWIESINQIPIRFERQFPKRHADAERFLREHIAEGFCQYAGSDDLCPSVHNPHANSNHPRCLLYATFADDLMVWKGRNRGFLIKRRYTTTDGQWLADEDLWTPPTSS